MESIYLENSYFTFGNLEPALEHNALFLCRRVYFLYFFSIQGLIQPSVLFQIMEIQQIIDQRYCSRSLQCGCVASHTISHCFWNLLRAQGFGIGMKADVTWQNRVCLHGETSSGKHICYMVDEGIVKWLVLANVNKPWLQRLKSPGLMGKSSKAGAAFGGPHTIGRGC